MSTIKKEIIRKPNSVPILGRSTELVSENTKMDPIWGQEPNAYSTGNQSIAIKTAKITLKPLCLAILFTAHPYDAKNIFKQSSLSKKLLRTLSEAVSSEIKQYDEARIVPRTIDSNELILDARHRKGISAIKETNQ
jgi:hypothetical protein